MYGETSIEGIFHRPVTKKLPWHEYLEALPDGVQCILQFARIHNEGRDIAHAIRYKNVVAVTDASVEQLTGTAAISWIITDKKENFRDYGDSG